MKTTEESGCIKGYDRGKQVNGRKRYLPVDTLGLLLPVYVTPANTSDQEGARRLLVGLKDDFHYYHHRRTHLALAMDYPMPRLVQRPEVGRIREVPEGGGLHHHYERQAT